MTPATAYSGVPMKGVPDEPFLSCENHDGIYMLTVSGIEFSLTHPQAALVRTQDIVHALAAIPRFNGHTRCTTHGLSVAQHSVQVMERITTQAFPQLCLAALLHDAHEAYMGDITTPIARMLGDAQINWLKVRLQAAIHEAYLLPFPLPALWTHAIKKADRLALLAERLEYVAQRGIPWTREEAVERFTAALYRLRR